GPLAVELNGPTAGTQYDQLAINGTVTLGGALNLALGFTPTPGAAYTVLDNDGTDAVTGTFAGVPEGGRVTAGGFDFRVSYAGGTGNDVTLYRYVTVTGIMVNDGSAQRSRVESLKVVYDVVIGYVGAPAAA